MENHQHRSGLSSPTDEDLLLFHEMQKREEALGSLSQPLVAHCAGLPIGSQAADVSLGQSVQPAPGEVRVDDDVFSSGWDKSDYDWLLTLPASPCIPATDFQDCSNGNRTSPIVGPALTVPRLVGPMPKLEPPPGLACGNLGMQREQSPTSSTSPGLLSSTTMPSRKTVPGSSSNGVSRSSTPTWRPSTPTSMSVVRQSPPTGPILARSSAPVASGGAPRYSSSSAGALIVRSSSTPSGRASISSAHGRPASSSSRPTTPIKRSASPSHRSDPPSTTIVRMTSVNKPGSVITKSVASCRASSPTVKALHPTKLPGFTNVLPPNLRTSMPEKSNPNSKSSSMNNRSSSNSRGSSMTSRSIGLMSAQQPEVTDVNLQSRRHTSSPLLARGLSFQKRDSAVHVHASNAVTVDRKMVDKTANTRNAINRVTKPMLSRDVKSAVHRDVKATLSRDVKSAVPQDVKSTPSRDAKAAVQQAVKSIPSKDAKSTSVSARESYGFGCNLSKKSLDMALRHMDIRRSAPNGFHSFMSNVSASSLYSIKSSGLGSATSSGCLTDSPITTSRSSSSMSIVHDPEGSELGNVNISLKGSKSPPRSEPDLCFSLADQTTVTSWLGSPGYAERSADVMHNFQQGMDRLLEAELPVISNDKGISECDNFTLELMQYS